MAQLRYGLVALVTALLLYGFSIAGATALFYGMKLDRSLDTGSLASDAFFGTTGDSAAIYNRNSMTRSTPEFVMIGASNMQKVPAAEIKRKLPGYTVSNLSVDGTAITQFQLITNLAYEVIPPSSRGKTIFVVGVFYGEFLPQSGKAARNMRLQLERYGVYRNAPGKGEQRVVPRAALPAVLSALRPLIVEVRMWSNLAVSAKSLATFMMTGTPGAVAVDALAQNDVKADPAVLRQTLIAERRKQGSTIDPHSFVGLAALARQISQAGDRLVIVDLPIPSWHAEAVPAFSNYQQGKQAGLALALRWPGVQYLDLQHSLHDDDFYDSVHPKPAAGVVLADCIAGFVQTNATTCH